MFSMLLLFVLALLFEASSANEDLLFKADKSQNPSCYFQLECTGAKANGGGKIRVPVRSAVGPPGPKGDRGPRGLQGPMGPAGPPAPGPKFAQMWVPRPTELQIAFYIALSQTIEEKPKGEDCPLIFDTVLLNQGNFYNATNGDFTVSVSGVYVFLLVISAKNYESASGRLMHNGKPALSAWCDSKPWSSTTSQAILHLTKGDRLWLQCQDKGWHVFGFLHSSLSGYLLFPM